jgi:hypothetical protein
LVQKTQKHLAITPYTQIANHDTFADTPPVPLAAASPNLDQNDNIMFWAVLNFSVQLTALHEAPPSENGVSPVFGT